MKWPWRRNREATPHTVSHQWTLYQRTTLCDVDVCERCGTMRARGQGVTVISARGVRSRCCALPIPAASGQATSADLPLAAGGG